MSIFISALDLCHSKPDPSLRIARGAQRSSLPTTRFHRDGWLERLNRLISLKSPMAGNDLVFFTTAQSYQQLRCFVADNVPVRELFRIRALSKKVSVGANSIQPRIEHEF
jgi:hypothetical protein